MDLNYSELKTNAPEWTPNNIYNNNQLNVAAAKEFIPGKGLQPTVQSFEPSSSIQQQQQQQQQPHINNQAQHYYDPSVTNYGTSSGGEETIRQSSIIETPRMTPSIVPPRRVLGSLLMPEDIRGYFAQQNKIMMEALPPNDPRLKEIPKRFINAMPLDDPNTNKGTAGSCGYPTVLYKVVNTKDGNLYALRRIDNVRIHAENALNIFQRWKTVQHANVIPLRDAFLHQRALFLMHDYIPGAKTVNEFVHQRGIDHLLPENILWNIITQLLTAIRAIHAAGLAGRGITPFRVLITGHYRARLSCAGVMHILEQQTRTSLIEQQQEDLVMFGRIILILACMTPRALSNIPKSIDFLNQRYSPELAKLVMLPFQQQCNIYDLLALSSQGLINELDSLYLHTDSLENELSKQCESDRMSSLLLKMGLINERPEYGKSIAGSWSETGDRYIIKLFRDYVFHQTDDDGKPWLDMGHIIDSLNKLDLGSNEKILLTSRDGRSILVVSYADIRRCMEESFNELLNINTGGYHSNPYS